MRKRTNQNGIGRSPIFTVKSTYKQLCYNESGAHYWMIWPAKIPLKIKICIWPIEQNAILTKDNLTRKNWSDIKCSFCSENETILHLFFECNVAKYECNVAKYVWSLVAFVIRADSRPASFSQYWL